MLPISARYRMDRSRPFPVILLGTWHRDPGYVLLFQNGGYAASSAEREVKKPQDVERPLKPGYDV